MKNIIIAVVVTMLVAAVSWATKADLPVDGKGIRLQACAPNLKNDMVITGNSQNMNVTDSNCWAVYVANDTKFRAMSTATKVGVQHTIPGGSWYVEATGSNKFINLSTAGATGTARSDKP